MLTQVPQTDFGNLRYLKGVGPKRALALEKLGIRNLYDLLYFFPRRYEDRSQFISISKIEAGQVATIRGPILRLQLKPIRHMRLFEMLIGDATGTLPAVWFNQPYLHRQFQTGQEVILHGKVDFYQKRLQMNSPEFEVIEPAEEAIHNGRITPIYSLTEGLYQKSVRTMVREAVDHHLTKTIQEFLPQDFIKENHLMDLIEAVREMHFPSTFDAQEKARRRIVFNELFCFEVVLLRRMMAVKSKFQSFAMVQGPDLMKHFQSQLPFELTGSQIKAIDDLLQDFSQPLPANRLLQGDVGSGKTVVAASCLYWCAKNNLQAAMLIPTEILAEQHYRTLKSLLEPLGTHVELLSANIATSKREKLISEIRSGRTLVLVGTHALLQEDVKFKNLALLVIDEQHKFGVHQRNQLLKQSPRPHQLVMTATPIPRTLALTAFGDMDVSVMRELPKGRQPIKTFWITRKKQLDVLNRILEKIKQGEQAYFIFPVIQETESSDLLAAKREYEKLKSSTFSSIRVGLVHGRLKSEEREAVMKEFNRGEIKVLVSTSIIEVGVDNPNATIMVIENAERFGLAQLHQMRGRIGRGAKPSECYLFGEPKTEEGQRRLSIMTETQDGFVIAEEDLKLRGPGDFLGTRQSGAPLFRYADPIIDYETLIEARRQALKRIKSGEIDQSPDWRSFREHLAQRLLT